MPNLNYFWFLEHSSTNYFYFLSSLALSWHLIKLSMIILSFSFIFYSIFFIFYSTRLNDFPSIFYFYWKCSTMLLCIEFWTELLFQFEELWTSKSSYFKDISSFLIFLSYFGFPFKFFVIVEFIPAYLLKL